MRVLIGVLILASAVARSAARLEDWRSDQALFQSAVEWTPQFPEPGLALGAVHLRHGQGWDAYAWTIRAAIVSEARPEPPHFQGLPDWRTRVRSQLVWIDALVPICEVPAARGWCS